VRVRGLTYLRGCQRAWVTIDSKLSIGHGSGLGESVTKRTGHSAATAHRHPYERPDTTRRESDETPTHHRMTSLFTGAPNSTSFFHVFWISLACLTPSGVSSGSGPHVISPWLRVGSARSPKAPESDPWCFGYMRVEHPRKWTERDTMEVLSTHVDPVFARAKVVPALSVPPCGYDQLYDHSECCPTIVNRFRPDPSPLQCMRLNL
jgi:hypothetical protein